MKELNKLKKQLREKDTQLSKLKSEATQVQALKTAEEELEKKIKS